VAATRPECERIFDVNLRAPYYTAEILRESLKLATVVKMNDAEVPEVVGLLGLALPGAVIFAYLLSATIIEKRFVFSAWLRPAVASLLGLIPLLIWLGLLYQRNGGNAITEVLWANSVGRFGGEFENNGHFEPYYYYLTKLPEVFLPWNILVFLGLWQLLKRAKHDAQALFFCCWLLAPFILLSLSSGKRMVYLLALYPAAAVIAANYCAQLLEFFRGRAPTSALCNWLNRNHKALLTGLIAVISAGFLYRAVVWEPQQDRKESFVSVMQQLNELFASGRHIALYQPTERLAGAAVFYTGRRYLELDNAAALEAYLAADGRNVALVQSDTEPSADTRVLYRATVGKRGYLFLAR